MLLICARYSRMLGTKSHTKLTPRTKKYNTRLVNQNAAFPTQLLECSIFQKRWPPIEGYFAITIECCWIPMWTGFNAWNYVDHFPKQLVLFMPDIDRSSTSNGIIAETLFITKKCDQEWGQAYGVVIYDRDVVTRAIKIHKVTERPRLDNDFIIFEAFHLQMCLSKDIGKSSKMSA